MRSETLSLARERTDSGEDKRLLGSGTNGRLRDLSGIRLKGRGSIGRGGNGWDDDGRDENGRGGIGMGGVDQGGVEQVVATVTIFLPLEKLSPLWTEYTSVSKR